MDKNGTREKEFWNSKNNDFNGNYMNCTRIDSGETHTWFGSLKEIRMIAHLAQLHKNILQLKSIRSSNPIQRLAVLIMREECFQQRRLIRPSLP